MCKRLNEFLFSFVFQTVKFLIGGKAGRKTCSSKAEKKQAESSCP